MKKEIEEDIRRKKDLPGSWTSRTDIVKMVNIPNTVYTFSAIPITITTQLFTKSGSLYFAAFFHCIAIFANVHQSGWLL